MIFEYLGFTIHRLGLRWFLIIGPGFWGYETTMNAAMEIISQVATEQCTE